MADYRLRPRARADLEEIWIYTLEPWSEEQADNHLARLFARREPSVGPRRKPRSPWLSPARRRPPRDLLPRRAGGDRHRARVA